MASLFLNVSTALPLSNSSMDSSLSMLRVSVHCRNTNGFSAFVRFILLAFSLGYCQLSLVLHIDTMKF